MIYYHQRIHSNQENQETNKKLMVFGHGSVMAENEAKKMVVRISINHGMILELLENQKSLKEQQQPAN